MSTRVHFHPAAVAFGYLHANVVTRTSSGRAATRARQVSVQLQILRAIHAPSSLGGQQAHPQSRPRRLSVAVVGLCAFFESFVRCVGQPGGLWRPWRRTVRCQRLHLFQIEWVRHLIDPLKYAISDIFMQHLFDFQPGKYDPSKLASDELQ